MNPYKPPFRTGTINPINRVMSILDTKCLSRLRVLSLVQGAVGLGLVALVLAGCRGLDRPGSASFASVLIQHHSPAAIQAATEQLFGRNGYEAYTFEEGQKLFEKEGTRADNLAYNGLVGTHYGAQTLVRVKTEIVALGGETYRLQCQAYMVRNAGESSFEEEMRLPNRRGGPYQELLNEVARSLK